MPGHRVGRRWNFKQDKIDDWIRPYHDLPIWSWKTTKSGKSVKWRVLPVKKRPISVNLKDISEIPFL
jgi:hypothetical protein